MGKIPKDTFKRLFLFYLIGEFKDGSYGKTRLEKLAYFIERELKIKPFKYQWHYYGQYSDDLSNNLEHLISTGHITSSPLDKERGNKYILAISNIHKKHEKIIAVIPRLKELIEKTVGNWGYKPEQEIIKKAYSFKEVQGLKSGDVIFEDNLPNEIHLENISEEECEDLELSFNPKFINAMKKIIRAIEEIGDLDLKKVKKIDSFL